MTITLPELLLLILISAIVGAIGRQIAGGTRGGLLVSSVVGFIGAALGPWITTLDEFGGPGQPQVAIAMRVNGEVRQLDNSRNMIFVVDELLDFIDTRVALQPGDLVFTGTPASVGVEERGRLQPGDRLASEIDHVGVLRNVVGPREQPPPVRLADGRAGQADKPIRTPRRRAAADRPRRQGGSARP